MWETSLEGTPLYVDEHNFLTARRLTALVAVPAPAGYTAPQSTVGLSLERRQEHLSQPGLFHRFEIARQLPILLRESHHLHDDGMPVGERRDR